MADEADELKHRRVARVLREEIDSGVLIPGERLEGELHLARRFDVSYMTMRQAIKNLVEETVLVRIKGKGTFVAQQRASDEPPIGRPMAILIPEELQRVDPYYLPEVIEGFRQCMEEEGRSYGLYGYSAFETSSLELGTAIACLLFERPSHRAVERLRDLGHPVLAINRYRGDRLIPSVRIDDALGVEMAVGYLASLGHERIGFVMGPRANLDAGERLRGFRTGVARYEIKRAPEAGEGFTEASGYAAASKLLSASNRPTAIVCASDLSAMGVIKAARDAGLSVPRGLSVVGYGDFSVAEYTNPGLTTVRQTRFALGRAAAKSLLRLSTGETPADIVLPAELVLRESAVPVQSSVTALV